jgi:hypothetical protein
LDGWTPDGWTMDAGHPDGWTGDGWTGERTPNSGHRPAPDDVTGVLAFATSATTLPYLGPPSEDSARQAPPAAIGNQDCLAVNTATVILAMAATGSSTVALRGPGCASAHCSPRKMVWGESRASGEASSVMARASEGSATRDERSSVVMRIESPGVVHGVIEGVRVT